MSAERNPSGRRVPTLTEVISPPTTMVDLLLEVPGPDIDINAFAAAADATVVESAHEGAAPFTKLTVPSISALLASVDDAGEASIDAQSPLTRVLADVQRQLDAGLDAQLHAALGPLLARATESLIRETREQLTATLHEMIERALTEELARHRIRDEPRSG